MFAAPHSSWIRIALAYFALIVFVHIVILWGANEHGYGLFKENRGVEWIQIAALILSIGCFVRAARLEPEVRVACLGIALLLGMFFFRELDRLLGDQWFPPVAILIVIAMVMLWRNRGNIKRHISLYSTTRSAALLFCGLIIVLMHSRLLGHQKWWKDVLRDNVYEREVPRAAEETSETLGYLFIFCAAVETLRDARRRRLEWAGSASPASSRSDVVA